MALKDPHDPAPAEYGPLRATCERLGYRLIDPPKVGVEARADFVLAQLGQQKGRPSRTALSSMVR